MAIYSIRDLEKLTGIKAHTIRVWEQRYHLIEPARTSTNIRYYTDENLRLLFNVALLNRYGHKISHLAKMEPGEIAVRVSEISKNNTSHNAQIDALTLAMIDLKESTFDHIFVAYYQEHGFERTMLELIYPFLDKLSILWLTNSISVAHERFIGNLIRRKIMCAIDREPLDAHRHTARFLLYTGEGESQELMLLFMHYLLRKRGLHVLYLGVNTQVKDVSDACQPFQPDYIFTILQEPLSRQSIQAYVDSIAHSAPGSQLLLTGAQLFVSPIKLPRHAHTLGSLQETLEFLDDLVAQKKTH